MGLPCLLALALDATLTMWGQPEEYWAGDYSRNTERNLQGHFTEAIVNSGFAEQFAPLRKRGSMATHEQEADKPKSPRDFIQHEMAKKGKKTKGERSD